MNSQCRYIPESERTEEDWRLAESAARASKRAIEEAFAAGLSITIARGNRIVRIAPDGTEVSGELDEWRGLRPSVRLSRLAGLVPECTRR